MKPVSSIFSLCLLAAAVAVPPAMAQQASALSGQYRNLIREVQPQVTDQAIDAKRDRTTKSPRTRKRPCWRSRTRSTCAWRT